jgi:hypothetical protein
VGEGGREFVVVVVVVVVGVDSLSIMKMKRGQTTQDVDGGSAEAVEDRKGKSWKK